MFLFYFYASFLEIKLRKQWFYLSFLFNIEIIVLICLVIKLMFTNITYKAYATCSYLIIKIQFEQQ